MRMWWLGAIGVAAFTLVMSVAAGANPESDPSWPGFGHRAERGDHFRPGNLLVSRSVYDNRKSNVTPGMVLPPGCTFECGSASVDGEYPYVWNNDISDEDFGLSAKIFLDQLTGSGSLVNTLEVPNSAAWGVGPRSDQLVTSFSSKSELSLNLSSDGREVTFMGYLAPVDALDISNANTPGVIDPTNHNPGAYYRVIAQVNAGGVFHFTKTNAYSGDNGRAAILNREEGANVIYGAGNAGSGASPQPDGILVGTGAQIFTPQMRPEFVQNPGTPTPVGSFDVSQLGKPSDKIGKDTNFRGITIHDHVLYYTKGSGGNGVNTVYFLDTTGNACPNGVGLPAPGAKLPTSPLAYDEAKLQEEGLTPRNLCILKGFPTALKSKNFFPFGIWFANPDTLYVAQEGNGKNSYSTETGLYPKAGEQTEAGLQKWVFNGESWELAYTLQNGLELGKPYTVPGYPSGDNSATGLPWSPATDGLRDIAGRLNRDGRATIWGITSTVSGNGDEGADPNRLVEITDDLSAASLPASENFHTVRSAGFGEVLRGVSMTPGSGERFRR